MQNIALRVHPILGTVMVMLKFTVSPMPALLLINLLITINHDFLFDLLYPAVGFLLFDW